MVDEALVARAAAELRLAAQTGNLCAPIRGILGTETDIDAGYAVQDLNTARGIADGRRVSGRKIGITSKAVMEQIGVDQPDFGTLFADMEYGDGIEVEYGRLLQPRAEAEIALVLDRDLDKDQHTFNDIIRATAYALPSIEIVDSRVADWDIRIVDTVADNASCGLYVLGSRPVTLDRIDLRSVPMTMTINGEEVSSGLGAACLGHPLQAARWLADTLYARGIPLQAGDVVMTGALGPMRPLAAGDAVTASFGDLGTVSTSLEKAP